MVYYSASDTRRNPNLPATIKSYDERRIVDFVNQRILEAREGKAYRNLHDNYLDYMRAYNGKFKNTTDIPKWRNRLYIRLAFKIVETLRAYFDDAYFGRTPYILVNPKSPEFTESAKTMESVMQHYAIEMKKRRKFMNVINYALKYGTAITRNYWNFQRGYKQVRQFAHDPNGMLRHYQTVERPYVKIDAPDFCVPDPVKVAFDPLNYLTRDMRYACEEMDVDFDYLWNSKEVYGWKNLNRVEEQLRGGYPTQSQLSGFGSDPFVDPNYKGTLGESQLGVFDQTRKRVSIMRYEGRLDMPGNQEDPRIYEVYVANANNIIKCEPSAYAFDEISYNVFGIIPQEDSYAGIGAIEPILTDQRILNILCNVRLDSLHLLISPRVLAHKNALETQINGLSDVAPGGIINVKSMNDINRVVAPLQMPDQGFNTFHQFWQMQNQHAEDTLAMNPTARGVMAQQERSATEVVRSLEGAHARFLHMVNYFGESGYSDHTKKEADLIQQFMENTFTVPVQGDERGRGGFAQAMPWAVQGDFGFEFQDPTKSNKEMEMQLTTQLLQTFAPYFQLLQPYGVTPIPFLKGILEASPMAKKLDIPKMFEGAGVQAPPIMGQENAQLEKILAGPSLPNSGRAPGYSEQAPQPEGTAMGIAMGM